MVRSIAGNIPTFCALAALGGIALWAGNDDASGGEDSASSPSWPRLTLAAGWQKMLLLGWAVLPFIAGYVLSVATRPILYDRYLIGSLPPFLLLAARGLSVLRSNRLILAGAVMTVLLCGAPATYASVSWYMREDMRALIAPFSERFRSSDAVVLSSPGVTNTFAYYYREPVPLQFVIWHPATDAFDRADVTRLWVFVREGIDEITAPVMKRIEARYVRQQTFPAYGMTLYLYTRPAPSGPAPEPGSGNAKVE